MTRGYDDLGFAKRGQFGKLTGDCSEDRTARHNFGRRANSRPSLSKISSHQECVPRSHEPRVRGIRVFADALARRGGR